MSLFNTHAARRGAVATLCLANIAASLLIWLAMALQELAHIPMDWVMDLFALPGNGAGFLHHPWTLVTYMVAQANPLQLLFNLLWLVWFGRILTDTESQSRLYLLYAGGGLTGGLFYLLATQLMPGTGSYLMGSSAAILAVMTYTAMRHPDLHVNLWLIGEVRMKWIAIATILLTFLGAGGIAAHCAHIGGIVFAPLLILSRRIRLRQRTPRRRRPQHAPRAPRNLDPESLLDSLLDKIRVSGYESLSQNERTLLDKLSQTITLPGDIKKE